RVSSGLAAALPDLSRSRAFSAIRARTASGSSMTRVIASGRGAPAGSRRIVTARLSISSAGGESCAAAGATTATANSATAQRPRDARCEKLIVGSACAALTPVPDTYETRARSRFCDSNSGFRAADVDDERFPPRAVLHLDEQLTAGGRRRDERQRELIRARLEVRAPAQLALPGEAAETERAGQHDPDLGVAE